MGAFEICFYGWKEGAAHVFLGPKNIPDVWSIKKVSPQSMIHLAEKPVELAIRARTYPKTGNRAFDWWEHIRKSLFFRHLRCAQYL
jgi:hypothetical protein